METETSTIETERRAPVTQAARKHGLLAGSSAEYAPELETFYRQFFLPLVRRAVRKQGMSFEDAGDVVQDAFILALGKLDVSKNPKAWLYQVVDHLAVNWQRKIHRRAELLARWDSPEQGSQRSFGRANDGNIDD
jgi:DNA-directed RNA polymerase specialized sigma24 family protein